MRRIHQYLREITQREVESEIRKLEFVEYVEDSLKYLRNKVRDDLSLAASYFVGLERASDWLYSEIELSVYYKDWKISHFGISWGQVPVFIKSKSELELFVRVFSELPFSLHFEKVTFDWKKELEELEHSSTPLSPDAITTYLKLKELEQLERTGLYRYRLEMPEYNIRTFGECIVLLGELNKCFKSLHSFVD